MRKCDRILENEQFRAALKKIAEYEKDRIYCLHNIEHAFDTARIAYIKSLERGSGTDKEIIYAAALVHDIGRRLQYEDGIPHDEASVIMGKNILEDSGFSDEETELILKAVSEHRKEGKRSELGQILYEADMESRLCMLCKARESCKWKADEMNMEVSY